MTTFAANLALTNALGGGVDLTPPRTGPGTLKRLRAERRVQRLVRDLACGKWRDIVLDAAQGRYPVVMNNAGKTMPLVVKLNHVGPAMKVHADILAGERSSVTAPEGYEGQQLAINRVKAACLWDTMLHQACELVSTEGAALLRCDLDADTGVRLELLDNERYFATGPLGPDQQPTVIEGRWVIEAADPSDRRKTVRVLRVETHWRPAGSAFAAVAQRAYLVESDDPLAVDTADPEAAKPISLEELGRIVPAAAGLAPVTVLPTAYPAVVQLVAGRRPVNGSAGAPPRLRVSEHDLDLLDAVTATLSRIMRTMELHGDPRMRVTEGMLDKPNNTFDAGQRALVDPDKVAGYIDFNGQFSESLEVLHALADQLLMQLRMPRALVGMGLKDGPGVSTYGELRLHAQTALTEARGAAAYLTPALERLWTGACVLDAGAGGMYDVAPVSVRLSVGLFQGFSDRVAEQREALEAGLTSQRRAVAAVHGDENAEQVLAEIQADKADAVRRAQESLMVEVGGAAGGGSGDSGVGSGAEGNGADAGGGGA